MTLAELVLGGFNEHGDYVGDVEYLKEAAAELTRLQGEIETLKDNYNTLLEAHTFEVARARTAEARAEAADREVERLTKEREGLSKDYGNLLAESNAHETATQAEQEKAQRLREWLPSVFDVDSLIGRVLIGKLDALGFAPATPQAASGPVSERPRLVDEVIRCRCGEAQERNDSYGWADGCPIHDPTPPDKETT